MPLQSIIADCGLTVSRYEAVHGGDINRAYCLYTATGKYFLKVNDHQRYPDMFVKEAAGLLALSENSSLTVPQVIKSGTVHNEQYLLMEWLGRGMPKANFWENFGAGLAMMHQHSKPYFGWNEENFIGSLLQKNQQYDTWHSFYIECRIMPLVKTLYSSGAFTNTDISAAESFCNTLENVFPPESPALLHGDLWSGNYMVAENGQAAIFDPAVYYGHREMDIGMTCLFGGFQRQFYDAYNNVYPLESSWHQRLPFTQLYPLLVHAILFGGHYVKKVRDIIVRL
ncbi:MAG: hypothetical protein JWP81_2240 [Ferruginibacter sp.]|nr:hypothetical protein [Ferruginibacter sp.]